MPLTLDLWLKVVVMEGGIEMVKRGDRKVSSQGGKGERSFTDRAEGHFRFHIPLDPEIDLDIATIDPDIYDVYPTIWKYQYANGETSNDTSG